MSQHRMLELDALRGIAAMAVVVYHLVYRYHELYGHQGLPVYWSYFGQYGVQLFFMISGFVIYWTLDRIQTPIEFVISRFSRLYPVYWVAIAVTFAVTLLLGLPDRTVSVATAFKNLAMFHEYFAVPHVDGVYWTLTLELTFYAYMFLLLIVGQRYWATPLLMLIVIANMGLGYVSEVPRWAQLVTLDGYGQFFLFGVALQDWQKGRSKLLAGLAMLFAAALTLTASTVLVTAIYLVLMAVFWATFKGYVPFMNSRVLVWLGAISYSLYLIHQNVGYAILYRLSEFMPSVAAVTIAVGLVTLLAYGLNRVVEVPSNQQLRKALKRTLVR
ncbi:acyltransferase [Alteromonas sp. ASW11-36]|uniref:Acyltransferase n=1 Tax=Alteromonas arenosi TaxID=3055817 RepID=A0ABT7SYY1_9ALTE|nr:acyltransferase [Alteromonas sp. ASW11-36]MDM7861400.1 acyltransferase [Alteromonas sp. ASW11-36]